MLSVQFVETLFLAGVTLTLLTQLSVEGLAVVVLSVVLVKLMPLTLHSLGSMVLTALVHKGLEILAWSVLYPVMQGFQVIRQDKSGARYSNKKQPLVVGMVVSLVSLDKV